MKTELKRCLLCFCLISFIDVSHSLAEASENFVLKASFYENASWSKIWRLEISDTHTAKLYYTPNALASPIRQIEKERKLKESEVDAVLRIVNLLGSREMKDIDVGSFVDGPEFHIAAFKDGKSTGSVYVSSGASGRDLNERTFLEAWDDLSTIFPRFKVDPRDYVSKEKSQNQAGETMQVNRPLLVKPTSGVPHLDVETVEKPQARNRP